MSYATTKKYQEALEEDYEAACSHCGWKCKLRLHGGCALQHGDPVYADPSNGTFGQCLKCKRHSLKITGVPVRAQAQSPKGFWKIPTE